MGFTHTFLLNVGESVVGCFLCDCFANNLNHDKDFNVGKYEIMNENDSENKKLSCL